MTVEKKDKPRVTAMHGSSYITICNGINENQGTDTSDGLITHIMSGCRIVNRARMSLLKRGMTENSRLKCAP